MCPDLVMGMLLGGSLGSKNLIFISLLLRSTSSIIPTQLTNLICWSVNYVS